MKEFFMSHDKSIKRVPCTNKETGECFNMLKFGVCFVGFSKELGELNDRELNSMKNGLQIVQLEVDPEIAAKRRDAGLQEESYRLCKQGENHWEEVAITGW